MKGSDGQKGDAGRGIKRMWLDAELHLWVEYDDGSAPVDLGYVGVSTPEPTPTTYTVTFVDYNGTELKKETVESGKSATAPADPSRGGYRFTGWDVAFNNVTTDLTVTATYTQIVGAYLSSSDQTVSKNETLSIPVQLNNCSTPIKTMGISISDVPTGISIKKGTWSSEYEYVLQDFNKTKLQGASTLIEHELVDGDIFNFQFDVLDTVEAGTYTVEINMVIKYFDANEDEIPLSCESVKVQITVN